MISYVKYFSHTCWFSITISTEEPYCGHSKQIRSFNFCYIFEDFWFSKMSLKFSIIPYAKVILFNYIKKRVLVDVNINGWNLALEDNYTPYKMCIWAWKCQGNFIISRWALIILWELYLAKIFLLQVLAFLQYCPISSWTLIVHWSLTQYCRSVVVTLFSLL